MHGVTVGGREGRARDAPPLVAPARIARQGAAAGPPAKAAREPGARWPG